jgi:hypothetical protein
MWFYHPAMAWKAGIPPGKTCLNHIIIPVTKERGWQEALLPCGLTGRNAFSANCRH